MSWLLLCRHGAPSCWTHGISVGIPLTFGQCPGGCPGARPSPVRVANSGSALLAKHAAGRNRIGVDAVLGLNLLALFATLIVVIDRFWLNRGGVVVLSHDLLPLS